MSKSTLEVPPLSVNVPTHEEIQACMAACFEWAESYDTKDWARLARCVAPELMVDYRAFLNKKWDAMPAAEFVAMASSPAVLGDPLLRTQHLVASSRFHKSSPTLIHGYHQLRVPHQKYTDATLSTVKVKGHAHGTNKHWYRRVTETVNAENVGDGNHPGGETVQREVWKFAGLAPDIRWSEYDFEKVFEEGRGELGESESEQPRVVEEPVKAGEKETEKGALAGRQEQGVVEESVALGLGVGTGMAVEGVEKSGDDASSSSARDAATAAVVPGVGA